MTESFRLVNSSSNLHEFTQKADGKNIDPFDLDVSLNEAVLLQAAERAEANASLAHSCRSRPANQDHIPQSGLSHDC